jgi:catechol 2,3-dioxygenase-like lactoylglutathione lyase family enzyme
MTKTIAKRISPMLAVANIEETLSFYERVLGFTPVLKSPGYAIVQRDGQTIHFQKADSEEVMNCVRGHTPKSISKSPTSSHCGNT